MQMHSLCLTNDANLINISTHTYKYFSYRKFSLLQFKIGVARVLLFERLNFFFLHNTNTFHSLFIVKKKWTMYIDVRHTNQYIQTLNCWKFTHKIDFHVMKCCIFERTLATKIEVPFTVVTQYSTFVYEIQKL